MSDMSDLSRNEVLDVLAEAQSNRFYGKYRGQVVNNVDPEGRGRMQVLAPEVFGQNTPVWALPCAPVAGPQVGFFALPPVGANVWVEFEAGNLRYPIWAGCFWASGEIDSADSVPTVTFLRTSSGLLRIDDLNSEVRIEANGATITMTPGQIKIEAPVISNSANGGKTELTAAGFDAQQGALRVV